MIGASREKRAEEGPSRNQPAQTFRWAVSHSGRQGLESRSSHREALGESAVGGDVSVHGIGKLKSGCLSQCDAVGPSEGGVVGALLSLRVLRNFSRLLASKLVRTNTRQLSMCRESASRCSRRGFRRFTASDHPSLVSTSGPADSFTPSLTVPLLNEVLCTLYSQ